MSPRQPLSRCGLAEIAGEFRGELKVGSLVVLEQSRLDGSFEVERLVVREGAQINGCPPDSY